MAEMNDREMLSAILKNIETMGAHIKYIQDEQIQLRKDMQDGDARLRNELRSEMQDMHTKLHNEMQFGFATILDRFDDFAARTTRLESDMYRIRKA